MVRLIMGANGAGKTKQLIELIHTSVESESGSVVCIEPKGDMTYDVSYNVRLVNAASGFESSGGYTLGWAAKAAQTANTGATGWDWRFGCAINLCFQ